MGSPSLAEVIAVLDERYPPRLAEPWDAVGLTCGDPGAPVSRVLFAVDPTDTVAAQAREVGADLIVTHHPLFLTGVHGVAALTPGGRVVHELIRQGCGLFSAHTNADRARPGVSDALAQALGVRDTVPLEPAEGEPSCGLGRVGHLDHPMTLGDFARRVADALPATAQGVRAFGDPALSVRRVAVCGGSGDSLLAQANACGADVYVTADAKHHRTLDHRMAGGCAVIDIAHWASEWPWLPVAAAALRADLGNSVEVMVSERVTDPWSFHVPSAPHAVLP